MKNTQQRSGLKIFVGAVILMVAAVISVGLYVAGSPGKERNRQLDEQRANELQQIAGAIDTLFDREARLPESLDSLKTGSKDFYYVSSIVDPKTGVPYEYRTLTDTTYELCATFDDATQELDQYGRAKPVPAAPMTKPVMPGEYYPGFRDWTHGPGRVCYSLDVADRSASQVCGLTNPCQSGQTCAQLPNRKGTYCVPAGKECLAAGCAEDKCVIMESYPVQVRCTGQSAPTPSPAPSDCTLMKEGATGKIECFGCGSRICKDPAPGWERHTLPPDYVGIPYSCYDDAEGACSLAQ